jgi:ATP-binding cassette, subfamily B, bacterial PglK
MRPSGFSEGFFALLARLWSHLGMRRRRQFKLLLGLMLMSTAAEIVSLGAVLPFLAALTAPAEVLQRPLIASAARALGIGSAAELVLAVTVVFAVAALVSAAIRIAWLWISTRIAFAAGADLSLEVYNRTLYQPYSMHVARSSSEIISGITKKVDSVVFYVLVPLLTLLSSSLQLSAIALVLLAIDPVIALATMLSFGGGYALIAWLSRTRLRRSSQRIAYEQTQVIKALQEGLGGIRDVLLDGTQAAYCEIYRQADRPLRQAQAYVVFNGGSPRFAMEALGMVLIAVLAYGLSRQSGGIAAALPMLGALALAAQRVLPALQQGYAAWANIAASHTQLVDTVELLDQPLPADLLAPVSRLPFKDLVRFEAVRFRYTDDSPWVLDGLDLSIAKGARIGFVGSTGSGKSTMLDLFMGLLLPTEGQILVDGLPITGSRRLAWQRIIAHVPQSVFLADTSVAQNIAFGVPAAAIDLQRVKEAARQAYIADFIERNPQGYDAFVGERGVRLSGGERQRIGIARALYKQATVLVFDEATSALDNSTEQSVMEVIQSLSRDLTILVIAHRLTTVRRCDNIVELKQGRIVAQGSYDELLRKSSSFRQMAQVQADG